MEQHELEALLARTPMTELVGYRLVSAGEGRAELALAPRDEFRQEVGRLHGGILATLGDTAAVYAIVGRLPRDRSLTSIEFKLNFLRPAELEGPELLARAQVVKLGRSVALAEVEIEQGSALVAKGLFTYLA